MRRSRVGKAGWDDDVPVVVDHLPDHQAKITSELPLVS
jgi:hypothetical protein